MPVADIFRRIRNLVFAYIKWFLGPRLFWLCTLVIGNALLFGFYAFRTEVAVRSAGLGLEMLGLFVALGGIIETRTFFGLPSLPALFQHWLSERPRWRRNIVMGAMAGSVGFAGMSGHGYEWTPVRPEDSLEKKVESLIQNVERLKDDLQNTHKEFDDLSRKHAEALKGEAAAREKAATDIKNQLQGALTNGLLVSLIGLVWLIVGIIMSTMSLELSAPW